MTLPEAMLDEAKEVLPANLPNWVIDKNARRLRNYQRQTHLLVYQGVVADATTLAVDRISISVASLSGAAYSRVFMIGGEMNCN